MNTLWFGTVSFDSCSRFILCLYCLVYYVYDNPTYEVANKLICILYLVRSALGLSRARVKCGFMENNKGKLVCNYIVFE